MEVAMTTTLKGLPVVTAISLPGRRVRAVE
jgi:hypothetical protein